MRHSVCLALTTAWVNYTRVIPLSQVRGEYFFSENPKNWPDAINPRGTAVLGATKDSVRSEFAPTLAPGAINDELMRAPEPMEALAQIKEPLSTIAVGLISALREINESKRSSNSPVAKSSSKARE